MHIVLCLLCDLYLHAKYLKSSSSGHSVLPFLHTGLLLRERSLRKDFEKNGLLGCVVTISQSVIGDRKSCLSSIPGF